MGKQMVFDLVVQAAKKPVHGRRAEHGARGCSLVLQKADRFAPAHQWHANMVEPENGGQVWPQHHQGRHIDQQQAAGRHLQQGIGQSPPQACMQQQYGQVPVKTQRALQYAPLRHMALAVRKQQRQEPHMPVLQPRQQTRCATAALERAFG